MNIPDRYELRDDEHGKPRLFDLKTNKFVFTGCDKGRDYPAIEVALCEAHNRAYREWIAWSEAWRSGQTRPAVTPEYA